MKLNIAYPAYGSQQLIEIDDEIKARRFHGLRISETIDADFLGEEFRGYVLKVTGGADKQGFGMKQGVLEPGRKRLLLDGNSGNLRIPKRKGARKRRSVRGCIVAGDISVLNLVIVVRGPEDLVGLTDAKSQKPVRLGLKRASKIRKAFRLTDEHDIYDYIVRRKLEPREGHEGENRYKYPKIQRLVTPEKLQRKRRRVALKKRRYANQKAQAAEYAQLMAQIKKEKRDALASKKRAKSSIRLSTNA
eukprot:TRINITY_DN70_c0_g2_i2.p1 TRINITY_DN70_c0_g2~~TRINITY_DN70_c0_g2_i2.p1  ORF type:complete len:247 (+),score=77.36 TRINITY_DN70_c0_g2_i2:74-814(+)